MPDASHVPTGDALPAVFPPAASRREFLRLLTLTSAAPLTAGPLLAEVDAASKAKKLKLFRTESVRVGFKAAYDAKDYATIVSVAQKLPESVLQEDEKLLMYYDVASMRVGE